MDITYIIDGKEINRKELINDLRRSVKIMELFDVVSLSKEYLGERLTSKAEELLDRMISLIKELSINPTQELVDKYNKVTNLFKEEVDYTDQDNLNVYMLGLEKASELSDEVKNQILHII